MKVHYHTKDMIEVCENCISVLEEEIQKMHPEDAKKTTYRSRLEVWKHVKRDLENIKQGYSVVTFGEKKEASES